MGQALSSESFFRTNVVIYNLASSGRSSKSFYDEGKWANCLATHADYYFIQFGHNDGKMSDPTRYTDPQTTYKSYLSNYVNQARSSGGIPVFLTSPTRRNFLSEHKIKLDDLQDYAQAMRELAADMNVPVLDTLPASIDLFGFIGETKTPFYNAASTSTAPPTPGGDHTHYNSPGAVQHCYLLMDLLLSSTSIDLAALRGDVERRGVLLQTTVATNRTVRFSGSTSLTNWVDYGSPQSVPASTVNKYFYIVGESTCFFKLTVGN